MRESPAPEQTEERGHRRPTRADLSVGSHEVRRGMATLGLHASQELLGLGVLERDRSQPKAAV